MLECNFNNEDLTKLNGESENYVIGNFTRSDCFIDNDLINHDDDDDDDDDDNDNNNNHNNSNRTVFDNLLFEIYDKWSYKYRQDSNWDSDTVTSASDFAGNRISLGFGLGSRNAGGTVASHDVDGLWDDAEGQPLSWQSLSETALHSRSNVELQRIKSQLEHTVALFNNLLVKQLKRRDRAFIKLQKNCDILTAILQASSRKRREDTKLKFVMEPKPGNEAFQQWTDAMRGVARLPLGLPSEIRKKVWLSLANHHISVQKYDWNRVIKFAFNEKSNPDDDALGLQIVKDLHRTGCDTFALEAERAILKRVLLAYARWNKRVGYCQGFNVLAAIILEVMERNEEDSLKVMVYLVDHILPESYFAQNLQALSIDMAVFRELLNIHVPRLATHLNLLQLKSQKQNLSLGNSEHYEPPLTNVFTMQWFLTLFATCLPPEMVLRIWDSIMLEGSEIILRTGLVIWELLSDRLLKVKDADTFYCTMRKLTVELAEGYLVQPEQLVHRVYNIAPIPFPGLPALRDRFTYNISPFSISTNVISYGNPGNDSADDDEDEELQPQKSARRSKLGCFSGMAMHSISGHSKINNMPNSGGMPHSLSSIDISQVGPGALSLRTQGSDACHGSTSSNDNNQHFDKNNPNIGSGGNQPIHASGATQERMSTDLPALETQYRRIRDRQKQTSLLINNMASSSATSATTKSLQTVASRRPSQIASSIVVGSSPYPSLQTTVMNHLFLTSGNSQSPTAERPPLTKQQHLVSTTSCSSSVMSITLRHQEVKKQQHRQQLYDGISKSKPNVIGFQFDKKPGSPTTSSVRPRSGSSVFSSGGGGTAAAAGWPQMRRSLSQSDLTSTVDKSLGSRPSGGPLGCAGSMSDITSCSRRIHLLNGEKPTTLLQLCSEAQRKQITDSNLEQPEAAPQVIPVPDINSVLDRHHKRIHTTDTTYAKVISEANASAQANIKPKLLTVEDEEDDENTEIRKTARWIAEHHNSLTSYNTSLPIHPSCGSTAIASNKSHYNALFGSRAGLFQSLTRARLQRSKGNNGLLRSAYESSLLKQHNSIVSN